MIKSPVEIYRRHKADGLGVQSVKKLKCYRRGNHNKFKKVNDGETFCTTISGYDWVLEFYYLISNTNLTLITPN